MEIHLPTKDIVPTTKVTGQMLKWGAVNERFSNSDLANQFVCTPRRKGYEIPERV
jgi:hypothetical protein